MSFKDDFKPKNSQEPAPNDAENVSASEAAEGSAAQAPGEFRELLVRLQAEKDDLAARLRAAIRQLADLDNARKRAERERQEEAARATASVIEGILPVLDAFERALAAHHDDEYEDYRKGFELIYRQLLDSLARFGLERIDALGKHFDPHFHQAVERVDAEDQPDGTVVAELRCGYKLRDRVLRPTLVRVVVKPSRAPATEPADADSRLN